jgi:hypothetical protein
MYQINPLPSNPEAKKVVRKISCFHGSEYQYYTALVPYQGCINIRCHGKELNARATWYRLFVDPCARYYIPDEPNLESKQNPDTVLNKFTSL